jgi:hypothetical protein
MLLNWFGTASIEKDLRKEFYRIARALRWSAEELEKAHEMQQEAKIS